MGCGGSKQDVATANTVSRRQLLTTKPAGAGDSHVKPTKPANENGAASGPTAEPPSEAGAAAAAVGAAGVVANSDVGDIAVNVGGRAAAGAVVEEKQEAEKSVPRDSPDGPDRFSVTRKEDESVEIDCYFSPRGEHDGKVITGADAVDLKEQILVEEETKEEETTVEEKDHGIDQAVNNWETS